MLAGVIKSSVQIRIADGGYIIQWMEPKAPPQGWKPPEDLEKEQDEKPAYLQDEERKLHGRGFGNPSYRPWMFTNPNRCLESKVAVRVELKDALELVGQILGRLATLENDPTSAH